MITYPNIDPIDVRPADLQTQESSAHIWKRAFDLLMASLVTVFVLVWLIPVVGLLICLTSPGPMLYIQWRTGRYGRPFRCLKFRTMRHLPGTVAQNVAFRQTAFNDDRVTAIGRWLRKTNLDEMPQFLNVLAGDMSLVGPRPHAIAHDAQYWFSLPDYQLRYGVLPGITGLAQVRGARGATDDDLKMQHRLRYDLFYIKNNSFKHDLQICWWTIRKMIVGDKNAW